jgi:hypothetical protein
VRSGLLEIFQESYNELRPGTSLPEVKIDFYAFANVNNTIRLRNGRLLVRLSDLLEGAPDAVLRAIAHILLAKMYRKPIDRGHSARYRKYVGSHEIVRKAHLVRQMRGRKLLRPARGHFYDLDVIFEELNTRFFHGLMARPRMSWSQARTRRILATMIRRTTPSSSAGSSIIRACRGMCWNTSSITRCCISSIR